MTPAELEQIRRMFASAMKAEIQAAVQSIQDDVDRLSRVDSRHDERLTSHSGTHRDIATNVRKSVNDIRETTNSDLLAASRHLSGAIEDLRREQTTRSADLETKLVYLNSQVTALQHVPTQAAASASAAIDAKQAVKAGQVSSRNRTIVTLIGIAFAALIQHLLRGAS